MKNTDVIQPLAMGSAIAADGDKEIPNQSEAGTNTSTINDGFLPLTSEPTSSGGRNPQRTNFNGMFYLSTDQRFYLQNGGLITYDPNVVAQIGGYPQDAILGYIDPTGNLGFVKSLINDNAYNFVQTPSYINGLYWEYTRINNPPANSTLFDGQWIKKGQELTTATSGTRVLDFSNYLPNDNYVYEVLFSCTFGCNSSNTGRAVIVEYDYFVVARGKRGDSNNNSYLVCNFMLPVPANRILTFQVQQPNFNSLSLWANLYRRVGTNT